MGKFLSRCIRHNQVDGERSRCQKCNQHEEIERLRSALREKENDLKSATDRLAVKESFYKQELSVKETERNSAHRHHEEELKRNRSAWNKERQRFSEREAFYKQELNKERLQSQSSLRSKCQQCEQQEYEHKKKLSEMEIFYKDKLNNERSALKQKQEELLSFKERFDADKKSSCPKCEQHEHEHKQRMTEMETFYKTKLQQARSDLEQKEQDLNALRLRCRTEKVRSKCQECERRDRDHKQSLNETMAFYKEKLDKTESALKQTEAELKSFKNRVAANMAVSIKTSNTESMNNPVSKTRLTEMYDNLKLLQWPKVKDLLKSRNNNPKNVKGLIQKIFRDAFEEMMRKTQQIDKVFGLTESSSGMTPQKIKEYRQLTVQNLQMALFHAKKEDLLETGFPKHGDWYSEEEMVDLKPLTSECYWLSCLMAFNNPPLQPDWKNHVPSMDPWDIFPREIKPSHPSTNF